MPRFTVLLATMSPSIANCGAEAFWCAFGSALASASLDGNGFSMLLGSLALRSGRGGGVGLLLAGIGRFGERGALGGIGGGFTGFTVSNSQSSANLASSLKINQQHVLFLLVFPLQIDKMSAFCLVVFIASNQLSQH
jgi:hypothetical protein